MHRVDKNVHSERGLGLGPLPLGQCVNWVTELLCALFSVWIMWHSYSSLHCALEGMKVVPRHGQKGSVSSTSTPLWLI